MLLRKSQRSSLPIGHLFSLANMFSEDFVRHLGQPSLLGDQVNFGIVSLSVDEVFDVLYEVQRWQFTRELLDVRAEAEADDDGLRVAKYPCEHFIQSCAFL